MSAFGGKADIDRPVLFSIYKPAEIRFFWGGDSEGSPLISCCCVPTPQRRGQEQVVYVATEIATQRCGTSRDRNGQGTMWRLSYPH
jgi:hypothetical protein